MLRQDDELACWLLQRQARASLIDCYVKNETDAQALEAEKAAATKNGKVAVKALEGQSVQLCCVLLCSVKCRAMTQHPVL